MVGFMIMGSAAKSVASNPSATSSPETAYSGSRFWASVNMERSTGGASVEQWVKNAAAIDKAIALLNMEMFFAITS
ncbi:hypothetical protein IMPR6_70065 [Imperialibacter sp. EC-SDR9]|nr:hypothetical protein IMPR6_70065 [Imperialibacter sp. EC-SDR9]